MANSSISDRHMLEVLEVLKETSTIRFEAEFARAAEMHKQSITKVRTGEKSFTGAQISRVCIAYNINANFVHGIEDNVFRGEENTRELNRILAKIRKEIKAKEMPLPG